MGTDVRWAVRRYDARGRANPSLAIRVSRVVGFTPSRSAAPSVPRIRHPVLSSTLRMCVFCTSSSLVLQVAAREVAFFGGLSVEETAAALGVSPQTVLRDWKLARAWLAVELRSSRRPSLHAALAPRATQSVSVFSRLLTAPNAAVLRRTSSPFVPSEERAPARALGSRQSPRRSRSLQVDRL
jgi:hypothetical protein